MKKGQMKFKFQSLEMTVKSCKWCIEFDMSIIGCWSLPVDLVMADFEKMQGLNVREFFLQVFWAWGIQGKKVIGNLQGVTMKL